MPRALKVFKTHLGFYDMIVAAPSMKAAAEAWDADTRIFAQGFAAQTQEPREVRAAMAEPGTVLRKPHGQDIAYQVNPAALPEPRPSKSRKKAMAKAEQDRKRRQATEEKARAAAEHKARQEAKDELAEIEKQEAELREKRRRLQKKFHLHRVK